MQPRESYTRYLVTALILTLAILVVFQLYIWREPERVAADEMREKTMMVEAGGALFAQNCVMCHGEQGEGVDAPALNDKRFLSDNADNRIVSLISSGVPGTEMPAWDQLFGGPFTDEEVRQLVAYVRNWEPNAPDRQVMEIASDPVNGLVIFDSTCFACHGETGQGTDRAPALNDPVKLAQFDDEWYADTIADGRPAGGMPTWGTVLSPTQINDLVALLRAWQTGENVQLPGPAEGVSEALHMMEHGDMHAVEHALVDAARGATGDVLASINEALDALDRGDMTAVDAALDQAADLLGIQAHVDPAENHTEATGEIGTDDQMHMDDDHAEATAEPGTDDQMHVDDDHTEATAEPAGHQDR